jgi:hypothetical protein
VVFERSGGAARPGAPALEEPAVHVGHALGAGTLVQGIDVLRAEVTSPEEDPGGGFFIPEMTASGTRIVQGFRFV